MVYLTATSICIFARCLCKESLVSVTVFKIATVQIRFNMSNDPLNPCQGLWHFLWYSAEVTGAFLLAPYELYVRSILVSSGVWSAWDDRDNQMTQSDFWMPGPSLQRRESEILPGRKYPIEAASPRQASSRGSPASISLAPNLQAPPFKRISNKYSPDWDTEEIA